MPGELQHPPHDPYRLQGGNHERLALADRKRLPRDERPQPFPEHPLVVRTERSERDVALDVHQVGGVRPRVQGAVEISIDAVHGDGPGEPLDRLVGPGVRELLIEGRRLRVALAWVRFAHVQRDEGDPVAELGMQAPESRAHGRGHRAGDRRAGQQQWPTTHDVALTDATSAGR
ncbi:MAG: hypothetical protein M3R02_08235, partial [Chloroflexota bacterium]|nr:hypothetical protein [Chloroflexota bacterium]